MSELNENKLKNTSKKFRVNDVTAFLGITPRILKHYETTGILTPERADNNDYREYSAEDVIKIQLAERLKATQLSQREIGEYFSGKLDIEKKYVELVRLREMLNNLIDIIDIDRRNGAPEFSITNEQALLCFCKTYPSTHDFLQHYINARDAYTSAINASCVCDVTHTFFSQYDDLAALPRNDSNCGQLDKMPYCVCVPITAPPQSKFFDGTVQTVTRKKSLTMKFADKSTGEYFNILYDEAKRRGLTLTGKAWAVTETGPNKKTANRTYTFIVGAEIE